MYGKNISKQNQKMHRRGGFTLVELTIVLLLVAILSTMTVSFSTLVSGYAKNNRAEYEFMEQCAELKEELTLWVSMQDGTSVTFTIQNDSLQAGDKTFTYTDTQIESIAYSTNGNLIKCTITGTNGGEQAFVLYLRCGNVEEGAGK